MTDDLIERLRAFVVERGKVACGSDIVSACNNSALSLSDLRALLGAIEAARKDAERYRWLRDKQRLTDGMEPGGLYVGVESDVYWGLAGNDADTAIDAAMADAAIDASREDRNG